MCRERESVASAAERAWGPSLPLLAIWLVWVVFLAASIALGCAGILSLAGMAPVRTFCWVFAAVLVLGFGVSILHFRSLAYTLDADTITKLSGRLWLHRRAVPLDQITSLDVRQGPLERLFGMGQVWIFTPSAGENGPEERLIGLREPDVVREAILTRCRQAKRAVPPNSAGVDFSADDLRALLETIRDSLAALREAGISRAGSGNSDAAGGKHGGTGP